MSNHYGSYMLNSILELIKDKGIFKKIGKESSYEFIIELLALSRKHDCNQSEILDGLESELGICRFCLKETDELVDGLCKQCAEENC